MDRLQRDRLFVALTRPQMFAGVTYSFFVINAIIAVELFLLFKSLWVIGARSHVWRQPAPVTVLIIFDQQK